MTEKTLTTENIRPALDALRGELAPWPVVAKKQDRLNTAQLNAANSGITSSLVAQIIANTAAIRALESAITGTGLRALVVSSLPAIGTTGILYIVPVTTYDPETDADVVNYSNEYIWIPVEGGTASEGHYEQVGQTGIVINNGQLTITVNGTSVGTFTANQSGDTTAAITVPTNADYVDRTTDQTVAGVKTFSSTINGTASKAIADEDGTSIKTGYVNVAGNQTVSGNKEFTGSNTFNNILPNATNTYSLGSSSYQWSSVYAQSYYYNGTAWGLDKENTWSSLNIFQKGIYLAGDRQAYVCPMWSGSSSGLALLTNSKAVFVGTYTDDASGRKVIDTTKGYIQFHTGTSGTDNIAIIEPTNTTNSQLGTSTNQWSSVYAQTYYYNGTEFQSKFVTTDTSQSISSQKTFNANLICTSSIYTRNNDYTLGTIPTSSITATNRFVDKSNADFGYVRGVVYTDGRTVAELKTRNKFTNGALAPAGSSVESTLIVGIDSTGSSFLQFNGRLQNGLIPTTSESYNCGTSTNKWKTLNGVNPGALSLPGGNYVEIDTTNWDKTGATSQSYTPAVHGWLYISIQNIAGNYLSIVSSKGAVSMDGTGVQAGLRAMFPAVANESVSITVKTGSIFTARFYPMLGNV